MDSAEALVPYAPLDVLKPVAPEIWIVDGPEIRFGYLGIKIPFSTRMTIIRLNGNRLFLHSPIPPVPELRAQVDALGTVRYLIAPNTLHYWWIPDWKAFYPAATVFAAPKLPQKAKRPLMVDRPLDDSAPSEWRDEIDQVLFQGSVIAEVDFFHRATRTLILTDLIENFEKRRVKSFWLRMLLAVSGAADPDGSAPYDMRTTFRDREAMRAGVARMIGWRPERVILAHGRWYETDGTEELRRAFRWVR